MEIEIKGKIVLIDDEDWEKVRVYKWVINAPTKANRKYYAQHDFYVEGVHHVILMHRLIMGCVKGDGVYIDHIDGNTLNNHKSNLRFSSIAENTRNQQKHRDSMNPYKGIKYDKRDKLWVARIQYNKKRIYVGYSKDPVEAAKAYDRKAIELHGEFAYTNFPKENYTEGATR